MKMHRERKKDAASPAKTGAGPSSGVAPSAAISRRRRWAFRLAAAIGIPLLLLVGLELALRLAGVGYPCQFFLSDTIRGQKVWVGNEKFGWRFFPRRMARTPEVMAIPVEREPGVRRVFILGESAAYGDPAPDYGLPRVLQVLLREQSSVARFEVVNAAMTAINSHVIVAIARDCARLSAPGDVWILYIGNNEVTGPFGAGTVFGPQTPRLPFIRANIWLKTTRFGQCLDAVQQRVREPAARWQSWGGMEMFLENHVGADDPQMARVYSHFQKNLEKIVRLGSRAGVKIVLCTVAVNLKDCAPFASSHRRDLTEAQQAPWDELFSAGTAAENLGDTSAAADRYRQAVRLDDGYAELLFRLARCEWANGEYPEAAKHFAQARDADTLRFRTDSRINQITRKVGDKLKTAGVWLFDAEAALAARSPHGVPGGELFYEHIHFTFEGNYLLACGVAEQVVRSQGASASAQPTAGGGWLSVDECAERLGLTDWSRLRTAEVLRSRLELPPFTTQCDHSIQYQQLEKEIARLQAACTPAARAEAVALHQRMLARVPNDWILRRNLGQLLQQTGDLTGAVREMQQVVELAPHDAQAWRDLGGCWHLLKRFTEAAGAYSRALQQNPNDAQTHLQLGDVLIALDRPAEALAHYGEAVRLQPDLAEARACLGLALARMGRDAEAMIQLAEVVRLQPDDAEAHLNLGVALAKLQRFAEAVPQFETALRLRPGDETIQKYLSLARARLGQERGRSE
jgi:tetratricopeptide (TPR) repeat protein